MSTTQLLTITITAIIGVLVGVFFKSIAETVKDWLSKLFHLIFDRYASAPFIRWRYEKAYRDAIANAVQDLQGGNLVERTIRLDQMYVPSLLTKELKPNAKETHQGDQFLTKKELRRRQQARAIQPWDAVRRFPRFVVLGAPGIGKTTYLSHLTYMCAKGLRAEVANHIPIFIRFRELVRDLDNIKQLEDILPQKLKEYDFPNAERFIEQRLKNGQCFLLLDGLDELSNEADQQRFIELVKAFANRHVRHQDHSQSHNILVVSSRKYSYEHGPQLTGFEKTEVMEFNQPAIEIFIYNWFAGKPELAAECLHILKNNARFLELARNPLLLLLISYHYERERNLPDIRAELYRDCIRTRVIKWNTTRGTHRGQFGEERKMRLLRELALHIFEQDSQGLLWRQDLLTWVDQFAEQITLRDNTSPEDLLEEVAITSGLIQEWAIDRYGFSHQTLQEFFAADAINRLGADMGAERLAPHLHKAVWKEVVLLYAGLADNAEPLIQLLTQESPLSESTVKKMLLAATCLAEGAQSVHYQTRKALTETLIGYLAPNSPITLQPQERDVLIDQLKQFASDLLPTHVDQLIATGQTESLLLAERLVPDKYLEHVQSDITSGLLGLVRSMNDELYGTSVMVFGRLGNANAATLDVILDGLNHSEPANRTRAAYALAELDQISDELVQALVNQYYNDANDAARHAALEVILSSGLEKEVDMIHIPAGEFFMRSRFKEGIKKEEAMVYLPDYFIGRTPVTNAQYRRFIEAGGYQNEAWWAEAIENGRWQNGKITDMRDTRSKPTYWDDKKWNSDLQPVVGVTWFEAMAFARWAGKRLPKEAEWEKAAGGVDGLIYPWGKEWQGNHANTWELKLQKTTPVGQFSPHGDSPFGCVDMSGNVWEWQADWVDENKSRRVVRGGSWNLDQYFARAAFRLNLNPANRRNDYGFRLVVRPPS